LFLARLREALSQWLQSQTCQNDSKGWQSCLSNGFNKNLQKCRKIILSAIHFESHLIALDSNERLVVQQSIKKKISSQKKKNCWHFPQKVIFLSTDVITVHLGSLAGSSSLLERTNQFQCYMDYQLHP